jgi:ABC-type uncharacterized transport system substrate-binding protein
VEFVLPVPSSRNIGLAAFVAASVVFMKNAPTHAHPHVFAEARLDVTLNSNQTVKSLRHLWRFDDLFSSILLLDFDTDSDLELNDKELEEISNTIFASLAEYKYFQLVTVNGKDVAMKPPKKLMATFENEQLVVFFESEPQHMLKLGGRINFGVYDPTFYVAIDFLGDESLAVKQLPHRCSRSVIRPDPDQAIADNQSTLTEAFFNDPTGTDLSKIFATRLELTCAARG